MLPRRFCFDAGDELVVVEVEEVVPFDGRSARIGKHLPQFVNAGSIIGKFQFRTIRFAGSTSQHLKNILLSCADNAVVLIPD
ncbi:hypothetical protein SF83666_b58470 (plasmid) [Sinorhizobium fredii CCBAU 83666]|nr:hypothetical protein SF83666_b58470 [Sinorhizobium fredii CCBAU 83666]